jgi:hypothetical protein
MQRGNLVGGGAKGAQMPLQYFFYRQTDILGTGFKILIPMVDFTPSPPKVISHVTPMTVSQIPWPLFQAAGSHHCNVFVRTPSERRLDETWVSSVVAAYGNNRYLTWESQATHNYTEWQHAASLNVTGSGTFSCYQAWYGYITVLQRRRVKKHQLFKRAFPMQNKSPTNDRHT